MKPMTGESIRKHRKALGLTQEQLAEAVGVTVGAVSKWEAGLSNPDIGMLVALADFFEISVDVLLGYQLRCRTAELAAQKLRELRAAKEYDEGLAEAEKALQRFPNSFDVVYQSAALLHMRGIEKGDRAALKKALALYERSCVLILQNTDETISELSIRTSIGEVYLSLDDTELGLRQLKKYNACGVNNSIIGFLLTRTQKYEEALPYLSESLLDSLLGLFRTTLGLANYYANDGRERDALDALLWVKGVFEGLKHPDKISYLDKIEVLLLGACAQILALMNEADKAETYLRRALRAARAFDAAPDFSVQSVRFYHGKARSFSDDFGKTAIDGIERLLINDEYTSPYLIELWERIKHEEEEE